MRGSQRRHSSVPPSSVAIRSITLSPKTQTSCAAHKELCRGGWPLLINEDMSTCACASEFRVYTGASKAELTGLFQKDSANLKLQATMITGASPAH